VRKFSKKAVGIAPTAFLIDEILRKHDALFRVRRNYHGSGRSFSFGQNRISTFLAVA
jgi:hypothetical protein